MIVFFCSMYTFFSVNNFPPPHPPLSPHLVPPPPGERPFKCESCSYLAANQHEVTRHARQVHDGPKPLRCPHCDYKTADRSNYKKHVELHLRPRQFLCPLCRYAASKKCNLQYHLKSRHRGQTVDHLDISKVKLRVKRPDGRKSEEEQQQGEEETTPINLSVRKSARSTATDAPPEKVQKKLGQVSEKAQKKVGQVPEKVQKVLTRQKKSQDKKDEEDQDPQEKEKDTQRERPEGKTKRRAKKAPAERRTVPQEPDHTLSQHRPMELDENCCPDLHRPGQQGDLRTDDHQELQKNGGGGKKSLRKNIKPRRSGSKRSEATKEDQEDRKQRAKSPETDLQVKEKPPKRKFSEALDLSSKASLETRPKSRRLKAATSEEPDRSGPATSKSRAGKQKKPRNTSKKVLGLQQALEPPVNGQQEGSSPPEPIKSKPNTPSTNKSQEDLTASAEPEGTVDLPVRSEETLDLPVTPEGTLDLPVRPEETLDLPVGQDGPPKAEKIQGLPAGPVCTTGPEETLDHPVEPEETLEDPAQVDDEGIHSSPEAGSDISDSTSEGSDDSGLKMANDPETPTGDLPATPTGGLPTMPTGGQGPATPTELKSLLCIFCDRSFPLQAQYHRHLQRHLVNVYFLDNLGQK